MLTDFSIFSSSLRILELSFNKLHGEIPTTIRSFAELSVMMLSDNYFEGIICESHFTNLSKLEWLYHYYRKGFLHRAILTFYIGPGSDVNAVDVVSMTHFTSGHGPLLKPVYHIGF
jgi:hypothetical protein